MLLPIHTQGKFVALQHLLDCSYTIVVIYVAMNSIL